MQRSENFDGFYHRAIAPLFEKTGDHRLSALNWLQNSNLLQSTMACYRYDIFQIVLICMQMNDYWLHISGKSYFIAPIGQKRIRINYKAKVQTYECVR